VLFNQITAVFFSFFHNAESQSFIFQSEGQQNALCTNPMFSHHASRIFLVSGHAQHALQFFFAPGSAVLASA
jgi:hypothetical protein